MAHTTTRFWSKSTALIFLAFMVIGFLLYAQTLWFDFTYFDDDKLILNNQAFLTSPLSLSDAFTTDVFFPPGVVSYYRPLLTVSLVIDALIAGISPFLFHLTNIIIHIVATFLVFYLFCSLRYDRTVSFFYSLFFLVHPTLRQTVALMPGRDDSLVAIFILLSIVWFIHWLKHKKILSLLLHIAFFILAVLTKETAFMLIGICTFLALSARKRIRLLTLVGVGILWGICIMAWYYVQQAVLVGSSGFSVMTMWQGLVHNWQGMLMYVGKVVFPLHLSVLPLLQERSLMIGLASVVFIMVLILLRFKQANKRHLLLGIVWFILFIIPPFLLHNKSVGGMDYFLDARLYVPLIGLLIVFLECTPVAVVYKYRRSVFSSAVIVLILFAGITFRETGYYRNGISFWQNAAQTSPEASLAHANLGAMYLLNNEPGPAEKSCVEALALNPREPMVHNNLGLIYMRRGDYGKAEKAFHAELEINPYYAGCYYNLGLLYYSTQHYAAAQRAGETALHLEPAHSGAQNLLSLLERQKKIVPAS